MVTGAVCCEFISFTVSTEQREQTGSKEGVKLIEPTPSGICLLVPINNWELSVQIFETMRDISHSDHHSRLPGLHSLLVTSSCTTH